ncbi:hypothetical protein H9L39_13437 [Fusarium oxysporum f. sp. albedinis]|nr:hypothetical protein H9L39_13437 [Fusarium oxysporum f. sp. albedinis]
MIVHTAPEGVVEQRAVNVQLPSINNRFLYTARPLLPLSRVFIIGSHKRTAEPPAKRSNSRVTKRSKTEDTSGSKRAASSPSLPAKSSGERDEATSQQGGDKSGVVPETSSTLEIISCNEQWKSDNKKELEYQKTDVGVRISTGDHFIVTTNTRFALHRAKGLDLSQLDLTSLPIRDIPEAFATFAGNKLGFA